MSSSSPPPGPAAPGSLAMDPTLAAGGDTGSLLRKVARTPTVAAPPALPPGTLLEDTYRIERRIGAGGMGVVYLARDIKLGREVAIKLHGSGGGEATERLLREAQAMARLTHPNVVTVHEVGTWGDHLFVAMEYVDGGTARSWLAERPRAWREIVTLYAAAGRGLAAAHAAGLIHRDFKPDNVLVGRDGRVCVADFGLARPVTAGDDGGEVAEAAPMPQSPALTATGAVVGTPGYMAPEQHRGDEIGPAADQFAFCAALWEALSGKRPFPGATLPELREATLAGRLDRPDRSTRVPRRVLDVLARGLAADLASRHRSMEALVDQLAHLAAPRRLALPVTAAAVAVAGATLWMLWPTAAPPAEDPCAGGEAQIAAVWNGERRRLVEDHLAASGGASAADIARRTAASFDQFATVWLDTRRAICRDAAPAGRSSQLACLDRRLQEVDATLAVLAVLPARSTMGAQGAALAREPVHVCSDPARAASLPTTAAAQAPLRRMLDEVGALHRAHEHGATGARVAALLPALERAGDPALLAAALHLHGATDQPDAVAELDRARGLARTAGDATLAARTAMVMAEIREEQPGGLTDAERWLAAAVDELGPVWTGSHLEALLRLDRAIVMELSGRYRDALAETRQAGAIAARLPGEATGIQVRVEIQTGTSLEALGELDEARGHHQRSLVLIEELYGPESVMVRAPLTNLGLTLSALGRHAEAVLLLERWVNLAEKLHGPEHLGSAYALLNLGVAEQARGHLPRALAAFERAHAIIERQLGPDHADTALLLDNLAVVHAGLGQRDRALELARRALAGRIAALGPDHPDVAIGRANLGDILVDLGRLREAEVELRAAIDSWTRARPDDPRLAPPLVNQARALRALGRPTDAAAALERAIRLREAAGTDPAALAATHLLLAEILWMIPRRRTEAVAAATRAHDLYAALGPDAEDERKQVDAWLRRPRAGR